MTRSSVVTYGHRLKNIRDPVRSPIVKLLIAKLVLRWVTTRESLVLYVLLLRLYPPAISFARVLVLCLAADLYEILAASECFGFDYLLSTALQVILVAVTYQSNHIFDVGLHKLVGFRLLITK